ncbi:sugar phosphate isomerase/epimerase family protein [Ohtaekwangia kribbensis]|jgi:sugar phosphate isomerase/epimerase|uniref:Sugar phosphate isomerase/epimerase family protein n=1 Tax=Ohtaekwangia kribbensis TaxID=688913 RepID=A0ABW3K1C3_9BACT
MQSSLKKILVSLLVLASLSSFAQEIGLQLYSLRNQFAKDVPGTMAKIRSFGIKEIEIGDTYGLSFPEFIKLIAQNQLQVVSYGTDFERLMNFPQSVADDARAYGAKFVVCYWIPHKGDTLTLEDINKAAAVFNKAGKVLAQNGLLLCYHPHGYEFQPHEKGTLFDYMVDTFDARYVYLQMDVFWIKQAGQDPVALLKRYANRWIMLHLKDRKPGTPGSKNGRVDVETNVILGQGDVGIDAIMRTAKSIGIKHYFIEDESSRSEEQIPASLRYLKSLK